MTEAQPDDSHSSPSLSEPGPPTAKQKLSQMGQAFFTGRYRQRQRSPGGLTAGEVPSEAISTPRLTGPSPHCGVPSARHNAQNLTGMQ